MKKYLLFSILSILLYTSCDNYKNYKLDGMWQLKTVKDINGNETQIDTVFYCFHRETVFSFAVLENSKSATYPFYGYVDMSSDNKVRVVINNISTEPEHIELFLSFSAWSSADIIFDIKNYNNTNLVLFDSVNGKTFILKKF